MHAALTTNSASLVADGVIAGTDSKTFVDRAVQTSPRPVSIVHKPASSHRVLALAASTTPQTASTDRHVSSTSPTDAYIHRSSGPIRSPPKSRKHSQLPYNRPSTQHPHVGHAALRVSSWPENSPSYASAVPRETRGASLTERPRVSLSFSDRTPETSSSAETSFRSRSGSSRTRRSLPSSDLPHTPSPPSSPESVMIIGNNMQVPIAFLRQKAKPDYDEETGWISWASSPPKPIPALHGPLSLPYARCPSGAEGTIIEGEDLSRMIWGLGLEESQPGSTANTPDLPQNTPSLPPRAQPQSSRTEASTRDHRVVSAQQSESWTDTFAVRDDLDAFEDQLRSYSGQRGLGLDWQETLRHRDVEPTKPQPSVSVSLKPSAPVFVPANKQQPTPPSQFPRIFVEPRHTILPSPRLSAMELAQQYRADKRPQDLLPTPPSSSSPQWTPQQHYVDPFPPLDLSTLVPPPSQLQSQSNFDLSQQLRQFVFERMQNRDVVHSADGARLVAPRISQFSKSPSVDASPSQPGPPPNSPLPPLPSYATRGRSHMTNVGIEPPSPPTLRQSSTAASNSNKHQPRSVPFARLLQRRLSAVPEEETPYEMHSPPPSPPPAQAPTHHGNHQQPGVGPRVLRAPRVPGLPSEGFQSRARSRSGSCGARTGLPSPALSALGSPKMPSPQQLPVQQEENTARWTASNTYAGRVKAPLKSSSAHHREQQNQQQQPASTKEADANAVAENLWEKENGKPKSNGRKGRGGGGGGGRKDKRAGGDLVSSPWATASQAPEAWL
uniref:Proteophosphoglycan ppg4 n=1 Tax=Mycena chlorophos TaxID=658473 RepID=A0ABQ0KUQ6_MYCCL|nr:predicted protein [Mycena chlorophos]